MSSVKNIIFDLGGVILRIDYLLTEKAFKDIGCMDFEKKYSQARQLPLFDDFETGRISVQHFVNELKKMLEIEVSDTAVINAWNAMLIDLPASRLHLLKELKSKYRIFLLSNTNEIHIKGFEKIIYEQHGITGLGDYFEKVYYSCRVNMRKPDAEIFELVLKENSLEAGETLFIDDSIQHVEGALKVGLQAKLLSKGVDVSTMFV